MKTIERILELICEYEALSIAAAKELLNQDGYEVSVQDLEERFTRLESDGKVVGREINGTICYFVTRQQTGVI